MQVKSAGWAFGLGGQSQGRLQGTWAGGRLGCGLDVGGDAEDKVGLWKIRRLALIPGMDDHIGMRK